MWVAYKYGMFVVIVECVIKYRVPTFLSRLLHLRIEKEWNEKLHIKRVSASKIQIQELIIVELEIKPSLGVFKK